MWLRQSTAGQEVPLGPFVDSTDGDTAETGLTIANTDIKIWVEGATTEANKNSGGATHIASGRYYTVLDATDTATLGKMEINVKMSGALAVRREFMVLPANVYDALVLGTDKLEVDTTLIEGLDATDQINAACDTALADYDAPTKTEMDSGFSGLSIPAASAIADAVLDEAMSGHVSAGSLGKAVADILEDTSTTLEGSLIAVSENLVTILGTPTDTNISTDIVNMKSDTAAILIDTDTTIPALISGLNNISTAQVNAQCDLAISDAFNFTVAGKVDSNVTHVKETEITGSGTSLDPWKASS